MRQLVPVNSVFPKHLPSALSCRRSSWFIVVNPSFLSLSRVLLIGTHAVAAKEGLSGGMGHSSAVKLQMKREEAWQPRSCLSSANERTDEPGDATRTQLCVFAAPLGALQTQWHVWSGGRIAGRSSLVGK